MSGQRGMTRRQWLRFGAGAALAGGFWPGVLRAGERGGEAFQFLVVNDTHSLDEKCGPWFERVVKQMKGHPEKVDFCLHLGDVAEKGTAAAMARVKDIFGTLGCPVYYVPGNHDYQGPEDRKGYEGAFPKGFNQHFEHEGWQFVGLDSTEGQKYVKSVVQPGTLRYLEETLPKLDRKRPTVVFTHFPLGPLHPTRPTNAEEVLARFKEFNLRHVFGGHHHALTRRTVGETVLTTNRCCAISRGNHDSSKEKGYFLCRARDGQVAAEFVEVKPE